MLTLCLNSAMCFEIQCLACRAVVAPPLSNVQRARRTSFRPSPVRRYFSLARLGPFFKRVSSIALDLSSVLFVAISRLVKGQPCFTNLGDTVMASCLSMQYSPGSREGIMHGTYTFGTRWKRSRTRREHTGGSTIALATIKLKTQIKTHRNSITIGTLQ